MLFLLALLLAVANCSYQAPFSRVVLVGMDKLNPTNDISGVLDVGHARMLSFPKLFSNADADAIDAKCLAEFSALGLSYPPLDAYKISANSASSVYPFSSGYDFSQKVIFDTANEIRGKTQEWITMDYGLFAYFNVSGSLADGSAYVAGDFLTCLNSVAVNRYGNWDLARNKQYSSIVSITVNKQFSNGFGYQGQVGLTEVVTEGSVGRGQISVWIEKSEVGPIQRMRYTITYV